MATSTALFTWCIVRDADPRAYELMKRHYSFNSYRDGRRQDPSNHNRKHFVGPGEKMVLLTPQCDALFVWRRFIDDSGQTGVNCAVFHNESATLASTLILEAEQLAWERWPGIRLYTYVDATAIRSTNPGFCFQIAGWHKCGHTKARGLLILEKIPIDSARWR